MHALTFYYGTVSSGKTMEMLKARHQYKTPTVLIKPAVDQGYGVAAVSSRIGLECQADIVLKPKDLIDEQKLRASCPRHIPRRCAVCESRDATYNEMVPNKGGDRGGDDLQPKKDLYRPVCANCYF